MSKEKQIDYNDMIGYFEKEALLEGIQKIINSCIPNKTPPMDALNKVVDYIMFFPTTDVVPKSEVDRLEQAYNARLAKDIETNADFVKYAKREVAREIFEEIQKIFVHRILHNESQYFEGVLDNITKDLDELQKKYTEAE